MRVYICRLMLYFFSLLAFFYIFFVCPAIVKKWKNEYEYDINIFFFTHSIAIVILAVHLVVSLERNVA